MENNNNKELENNNIENEQTNEELENNNLEETSADSNTDNTSEEIVTSENVNHEETSNTNLNNQENINQYDNQNIEPMMNSNNEMVIPPKKNKALRIIIIAIAVITVIAIAIVTTVFLVMRNNKANFENAVSSFQDSEVLYMEMEMLSEGEEVLTMEMQTYNEQDFYSKFSINMGLLGSMEAEMYCIDNEGSLLVYGVEESIDCEEAEDMQSGMAGFSPNNLFNGENMNEMFEYQEKDGKHIFTLKKEHYTKMLEMFNDSDATDFTKINHVRFIAEDNKINAEISVEDSTMGELEINLTIESSEKLELPEG